MTIRWFGPLKWHVALVALVCAGMLHITMTFLAPQLAKGSAAQRIATDLPVNKMVVLPPASAKSQPLPFMSPDMRYAVCRYDAGSGPVAVSATLADKGWSFGLYTLDGDGFYAVPSQTTRRIDVGVVLSLSPPADRPFSFLGFGRSADQDASSITVPQREGLVIIRASLKGQAYVKEIEAYLGRATCAPQRPG
jgi:uncharacterized membrane protein